MDVITAIRERRSTRAFLNKPVPNDTLREILDVARFAPSGVNTQPWRVAVVGPLHRAQISAAILDAKARDIPENPDYDYYPTEWFEPYKSRRKACGLALYGALGIAQEDVRKTTNQWYRNYRFFDAPAALIFYIDARLCKGSWMDMGMFIQNVMLAARGILARKPAHKPRWRNIRILFGGFRDYHRTLLSFAAWLWDMVILKIPSISIKRIAKALIPLPYGRPE